MINDNTAGDHPAGGEGGKRMLRRPRPETESLLKGHITAQTEAYGNDAGDSINTRGRAIRGGQAHDTGASQMAMSVAMHNINPYTTANSMQVQPWNGMRSHSGNSMPPNPENNMPSHIGANMPLHIGNNMPLHAANSMPQHSGNVIPTYPMISIPPPIGNSMQAQAGNWNSMPSHLGNIVPPSHVLPIAQENISLSGSSLSSLSVNAAVFVPRHTTVRNFTPAVENEDESQDQQSQLNEDFNSGLSLQNEDQNSEPDGAVTVEEFKSTLLYLNTRPGLIHDDVSMTPMVERLGNAIPDQDTLTQIVQLIIEQGISESNFRYTGARLCQYLSTSLHLQHSCENNFRSTLLTSFRKEFELKDELICDPEKHLRLCGLTMFLGELFINMTTNKGEKIGPFRSALKDLLLLLMSRPTDETIKTVCQVLKMTGAVIVDTEPLEKASSYMQVFGTLQELSNMTELNKTSHLLITSVMNLLKSNWGRTDMPPSPQSDVAYNSDPNASSDPNLHGDEPVFFNEQGQPISRTEADDYSAEFTPYTYDSELCNGDGPGYPQWATPDDEQFGYDVFPEETGMDDEMDAAFEAFLNNQ